MNPYIGIYRNGSTELFGIIKAEDEPAILNDLLTIPHTYFETRLVTDEEAEAFIKAHDTTFEDEPLPTHKRLKQARTPFRERNRSLESIKFA